MKRREFHDQSGIEEPRLGETSMAQWGQSPIAAFLLTCRWATKPKKVFLHRGLLLFGDGILEGERVRRKAIGDPSTPRTPFRMTALLDAALRA